MGRDHRPPVTRYGMMRAGAALAISVLVLLSGCGGHANVQATSGGGSAGAVPGGTSVNVQGRSNFGNLLGIGILAGVAYGSEIGNGRAGSPAERVSEPDPARRVAVQDCSKAIEDWSANLKCR